LSDYTAYDRLDVQGLVGANTINSALTVFNNRLTAACNTMKANNIVVYTITFTSVITAATKAIYRNCATDQTKYFDAPTQAELSAAFTSIAASLSNLRVTQ
jgi:hypothetical protein